MLSTRLYSLTVYRPYRGSRNRLLWTDRISPAHTYLIVIGSNLLIDNTSYCVLVQMVRAAAAASQHILLRILSPARLREALRRAGNIVKPHEIEPVLKYAASDGHYRDLNDLHLVLLRSGKVGRLGHGRAARRKTYYVPNPGQTHRIYDLMPHWYQQIQESDTWRMMAEYVFA